MIRYFRSCSDQFIIGGDFFCARFRTHRRDCVIAHHIVELGIRQSGDGIFDTVSGQYQGGTAGNAQDRHHVARFVAHQITYRNLRVEAETVPNERHAFQKHTFAILRRFRTHHHSRVFPQRGMCRPRSRSDGAQQRDSNGNQCIGQVVGNLYGRQTVHGSIGIKDDRRENIVSGHQTE
ncbi:hypothetical protein SDC9_127029 [bioreactor metagenome]|uniref:Uncharacterized protein n=1 Tax=bioreactor metagenome TaxID=1076179 RepID=A0A645CS98_9ZZZZ